MDLGTWWRDRRWMALLELIEQMPTACRWREALSQDAEHARAQLDHEAALADDPDAQALAADAGVWAPPWREYDLAALQMREVINLLQMIGQGLGVISGGSEFPGPATALDKIRDEQQFSLAALIIGQMMPSTSPKG